MAAATGGVGHRLPPRRRRRWRERPAPTFAPPSPLAGAVAFYLPAAAAASSRRVAAHDCRHDCGQPCSHLCRRRLKKYRQRPSLSQPSLSRSQLVQVAEACDRWPHPPALQAAARFGAITGCCRTVPPLSPLPPPLAVIDGGTCREGVDKPVLAATATTLLSEETLRGLRCHGMDMGVSKRTGVSCKLPAHSTQSWTLSTMPICRRHRLALRRTEDESCRRLSCTPL